MPLSVNSHLSVHGHLVVVCRIKHHVRQKRHARNTARQSRKRRRQLRKIENLARAVDLDLTLRLRHFARLKFGVTPNEARAERRHIRRRSVNVAIRNRVIDESERGGFLIDIGKAVCEHGQLPALRVTHLRRRGILHADLSAHETVSDRQRASGRIAGKIGITQLDGAVRALCVAENDRRARHRHPRSTGDIDTAARRLGCTSTD